MKEPKKTGMNFKEAAEALGIRKGQAIMLAEAGFLKYINNGNNGKLMTATFDSVYELKRKGGIEEALVSAKKFLDKLKHEEPKPVEPIQAPAEKPTVSETEAERIIKLAEQLTSGINALVTEVRQLKGIICSTFRRPQGQPELPLGV